MYSSPFKRILALLCSVLDAYSAVLFLADSNYSDNSRYPLTDKFSLGDSIDEKAIIIPGKGLAGWIIKNREPLLVPNFDQHKNHLGYYNNNEERHIKAFMGCALPNGLGILCADSKRQYSFSEKDQKILQLFGELIAELYTANKLEKTQSTINKNYEALKNIYVLRKKHSRWYDFLSQLLNLIASTVDCNYASFCAADFNSKHYTIEKENTSLLCKGSVNPTYGINSGVIGWVFRNGVPIFGNTPGGLLESSLYGKSVITPNFQTIIALPVVIQRQTRGVLCIAREKPLEITGDIRDFTLMISEHLALFLENLYIKCRMRDMYEDFQKELKN